MSMVEKPDFVAELVEFQLTGHKHSVLVGEFNGITDNAMHVTNILIIQTKTHEKKKTKKFTTEQKINF
jgi:hypothetical protein